MFEIVLKKRTANRGYEKYGECYHRGYAVVGCL